MSQQVSITVASYYRAGSSSDLNDPYGLSSYFDVKVNDGGGYFSSLGWSDAWCLNADINVGGNHTTYTANIYSSTDPDLPISLLAVAANLGKVNWILNQDFTSNTNQVYSLFNFNYGEVQSAIWYLMGSPMYTTGSDITGQGAVSAGDVQAILNFAVGHENFVPNDSQYKTYIIDPFSGSTHYQPIILVDHPKSSLAGVVYHDQNADHQYGNGDTGIAGVTVTLYKADGVTRATDVNGNTVAAQVTSADGNYIFSNLLPATYIIKETQPTNYQDAAETLGSQGGTTNPSGQNDVIKAVLSVGVNGIGNNFGEVLPASLGDRLWLDTNTNGKQDAGENGISGQSVTLIGGGADGLLATPGDNTSVTATTGTDGFYQFTGLTPGVEYQVQFSKPAGYVFTGQDLGGDDSKDSDVNATGVSQVVKLSSGENNPTIDAGLYQTAEIGDRVWLDKNGDGRQDAGEAGVEGATVNLKDAGGNTVASQQTGADGHYLFTGLIPGAYSVAFEAPATYQFTKQGQGSDISADSNADANGDTAQVTLASGESNLTVDAGLVQFAHLGDYVWEDKNADGKQDPTESGIADVTVQLKDQAGNVITSTTTDSSGYYNFDVVPGTYSVAIVSPVGYVVSPQDQGGDDAKDSDINPATKATDQYTVASGETNHTIDAGLYKTTLPPINNGIAASLGDRVWVDGNHNGIQDGAEVGVADVQVKLLDGNGAPVYINGVPATATTDVNGNYLFAGLIPGQYQVQFVAPAGYLFTTQDANNNTQDSLDSDANVNTGITQTVTLAAGENNLTVDAGVYQLASLGDKVWLDANANGIQDKGEAGVADVKATLVGGGADGLLSTTADNTTATATTDASGLYGFTGLTPGVEYQVQFDKATLPAGSVFTTPNVGTDQAADSNAAVADGKTATVVLSSGENNATIDAGIYQPASLGDRVWLDANANGIQDKGEAGVQGVKVILTGAGADGKFGTGDDTTATQTTDASGGYLFSGLVPGQYQVQFGKGTLPAGYVFTAQNAGADDAADSDASAADGTTGVTYTLNSGDSNLTVDAGVYAPVKIGDYVWLDKDADGVQGGTEAGIGGVTLTLTGTDGAGNPVVDHATTAADGSYHFTEAPGTYTVAVDASNFAAGGALDGYSASPTLKGAPATDSNPSPSGTTPGTLASGGSDQTLDFGYYQPVSLGDRVWLDANANGIQDGGEAGVFGVKATLTGGGADGLLSTTADNTTATATTDASGLYGFTGLTPGVEYQVGFSDLPVGYQFTQADADSNSQDTVDSDANTSTGKTQIVTLASGENNPTLDAGIYQPVTAASLGDRVWSDCNGNGVQDGTEAGIAGITVKLLDANNQVVSSTVTDTNGNYLFSGLAPANYSVSVVAPIGYQFTTANQGGDDTKDSDVDANGNTAQTALASGENDLSWDAGLQLSAAAGASVEFNFNGSSATDGTNGNIRTYTDSATGLSVKASAFSEDRSTGSWATAWLGSYSGGLGVTDRYEGDGTGNAHTVDNTGGYDNYVLFEFNKSVVLDRTYLGYVVNDSDVQVWIGNFTDPYNSHLSLNSSVLGGMGFTEVNATTSSSARWADLNAGKYAGNVIVIAADTTDTSPEDMFKIQKLDVDLKACAPDPAHIGDRVWLDANGNGAQDAGESGVANVAVQLKDSSGNVVGTTTTDANGLYGFDVAPGSYSVKVTAPAGYELTGQNLGGDDAKDSDVGSNGETALYTLAVGQTDTTVDAGLVTQTATASLGDKVWLDANANGTQDAGENGVASVTVDLVNASNSVIATTTTDSAGLYQFTGLAPGDYQVKFNLPSGYTFTSANQGSDDSIDSDANMSSGLSPVVSLASGDYNPTIDAGLKFTSNGGPTGPGVGTPGFWKQWTQIWDGDTSNDSKFNTKANFAKADILYTVTDPVEGTNTTKGLLIGDWNHNGVTDGNEHTIFYSLSEAKTILGASDGGQDSRYILDKHLVTTWLNVMAGNNYDKIQTDVNNAIEWLQKHTPNEGGHSDSAGDGNLTVSASAYAVPSSMIDWHTALGTHPDAAHSGMYYGEAIKNVLDYYNNTGAGFALDRDTNSVGGDLVTLTGSQAYQADFHY